MTMNLATTFLAFCPAGRPDMDCRGFSKLCKDCRLYSATFSATDAELIFISLATQTRRICFAQFEDALRLVAQRKGVEVADLRHSVAQVRRPRHRGTQPSPSRLHDRAKSCSSYGLRHHSPSRKQTLNIWEEPVTPLEEIRSRSFSPPRNCSAISSVASSQGGLTTPRAQRRRINAPSPSPKALMLENGCGLRFNPSGQLHDAIENVGSIQEARANQIVAETMAAVQAVSGSCRSNLSASETASGQPPMLRGRQPRPEIPAAIQRGDASPGRPLLKGNRDCSLDRLRNDSQGRRVEGGIVVQGSFIPQSPSTVILELDAEGEPEKQTRRYLAHAGSGTLELSCASLGSPRQIRKHLGHAGSGALELSCASLSISNLNIEICNGSKDRGLAETHTTLGSAGDVSMGSAALVRLQVMGEKETAVVVPCQTTVGQLAAEFAQGSGPWQVHLQSSSTNSGGRKVLLSQQMTVGHVVGAFRGPGAVPSFVIDQRPLPQRRQRSFGSCCGAGLYSCWLKSRRSVPERERREQKLDERDQSEAMLVNAN